VGVIVCKLAKELRRDKTETGNRRAVELFAFNWSRKKSPPHPEVKKKILSIAHVPLANIHFPTQIGEKTIWRPRTDPCWVWCEELMELDWETYLKHPEKLWRYELLHHFSTYPLKYGLIVTP